MNDREVIIQTTCTILYYARAMNNSGTPLEDGEVQCLMETFRIALFPHLSPDYLANKFQEVEEADRNMSRLGQQVIESSGNEGGITP